MRLEGLMRLPNAKDPCHVDDQPGPDRVGPCSAARLRHLIRDGTTAQQLVERARIVMLAAQEWTNTKIASRVGVCVDTVRK